MTGIEWTDQTWNPATGCDKVSSGCGHCYAEVMAKRLQANGTKKYANGFKYTEHEGAIELPLKWKKPRMVFVNSMSDFFHEKATLEFQSRCVEIMAITPEHTYQILTKRPTAAVRFVREWMLRPLEPRRWPRNVWLGTSVENEWACRRLRELAAAHECDKYINLFASFEPLLGRIPAAALWGNGFRHYSWAIVGGESGPGHRPMEADWAREIRDACRGSKIPFFFKQWGGATPKSGGCELDGQEHKEWPEAMRAPGRPLVEALA